MLRPRILILFVAELSARLSRYTIGPNTAAAVERVYEKAGDYLVDAYGIARRNYYFRIADRRGASRKYARTRAGGKGGWIRRAEEFISPRFHMTSEQFNRRVSKWA